MEKRFPPPHDNLESIRQALFHTQDLTTRELSRNGRDALLVYLHTLADGEKIREGILDPLLSTEDKPVMEVITSAQIKKEADLNRVNSGLLLGQVVLLLEGVQECFLIEAPSLYKPNISEPDNEKVIRGSHVGFVETLSVNLHLIRKRTENRHLTVRYLTIGKMTQTKIALVYMHNLVNPDLMKEIEKRLHSIQADTLLSPGFIEEYIEEKSFSPFPQMLNTEWPDRVMGHLMEGRVALLAEGSPTALIAPVTFNAFYQSPDDYNSRTVVASFMRVIRFISFFTAILLPAFYISVIAFHFEVIPVELVFPMKSSVETVPFTPLLEALLLELTVELIREGGIRLPSPVGQTLGIVGGLVIGESAVQAGLVSNTMVIVVALTALSSFVIPSHEMGASIRFLRFPFMFLSATFGFLGICFGLLYLLIHLAKLSPFGTPYFSPATPLRLRDMKDTLIRLPIWKLNRRPVDAEPQKLTQERYSRSGNMAENKVSITQGQFLSLILHTQFATSPLSLPYAVATPAKADGWIAVLLCGVGVQIALLLLWALNRRFPSRDLFDFLPRLLGKLPGKVVTAGYIIFFTLTGSTILILYFGIIHSWMLPTTPKWAILGLMVLAGMQLVSGNLRIMARLYLFMSGLILLLVLSVSLVYLDPYTEVNVHYVMPIGQIAGFMNLLKGAHESVFALLGFELILVVYPFVEGSATGKLKAASLANWISTLLYSFLTLTVMLALSPVEMSLIPEPLIYMLKAFTYRLVERPDLYFLSLWSILAFSSFSTYVYLASLGTARLLNRSFHRKWVIGICLAGYVLALLPQGQHVVDTWIQIVTWSSYGFILGLPLLLLLISILAGKKEERGVTP